MVHHSDGRATRDHRHRDHLPDDPDRKTHTWEDGMLINTTLRFLCIASAALAPIYIYLAWGTKRLDEFPEFVKFVGILAILSICAISAETLNARRKIAAKRKGKY